MAGTSSSAATTVTSSRRDLRRKLMWMPRAMRRRLAQTVGACPPWLLTALLRPLGVVVPYFRVSQPSDKAYKAAGVLALADGGALYRDLVSHWKDPSSLVLGAREPATLLDELLMRPGVASTFEQWMMTTDMLTYLPDDILVKVDRAAMAVSLETRVPFLDHRLVEFALSLPLPMKIRDGQGKWLLRQMLYKYVPKTLIERPKMGFGVPIDSWLRGPLRDWASGPARRRAVAPRGISRSGAHPSEVGGAPERRAQLAVLPLGRADVPGVAGRRACLRPRTLPQFVVR